MIKKKKKLNIQQNMGFHFFYGVALWAKDLLCAKVLQDLAYILWNKVEEKSRACQEYLLAQWLVIGPISSW